MGDPVRNGDRSRDTDETGEFVATDKWWLAACSRWWKRSLVGDIDVWADDCEGRVKFGL